MATSRFYRTKVSFDMSLYLEILKLEPGLRLTRDQIINQGARQRLIQLKQKYIYPPLSVHDEDLLRYFRKVFKKFGPYSAPAYDLFIRYRHKEAVIKQAMALRLNYKTV